MNKEAIHLQTEINNPSATNHGINIIFKGLDRCNAGCSFCSIGDPCGAIISRDDFSKMADELEKFVIAHQLNHITFTFHGGEPTLLGADLLDSACKRIRRIPATIVFNMQSNMHALPESVRKVTEAHKIKFGTSIDPLGIDRLKRDGTSGFPSWLRTFVKYARNAEPPGAIYVVTKHSLGKERKLYDLCETIGSLIGQRMALQINPVYAQGKAFEQQCELAISPKEFGLFMVNFWRVWENNRRSISVTPLQIFANHFLTVNQGNDLHLPCSFNGNCPGSHVGIDYNLNVAGCGRRLDSHAILGNLHSTPLTLILGGNEERRLLSKRVTQLRQGECKDCNYFSVCHGGCPDDAWLETGDVMNKSHWCEGHQLLFQVMEKEIRQIRRPASAPPSIPKKSTDLLNIIIADSIDLFPQNSRQRTEIWMLPNKTSNWLRFDSPLLDIKSKYKSSRMRLWCYNNQVASLMMWEDLLRTKGVSVVLFEGEGLVQALNILNSLHALIILDIISILQNKDGEEVLHDVLKRYTSDPLWNSQILPFTNMINGFINREPIRLRNEFGLVHGHYNINNVLNQQSENSISRSILYKLEKDQEINRVKWLLQRLPCIDCSYYRFCGMRFSKGDDNMCDSRIRNLLAPVHKTALSMQTHLNGIYKN